jgi:hypothetical protein
MNVIEIPAELLSPTIEELEEKTAKDLAAKWKPCKRLGKKERLALKQKKEAAKLKAIADEFYNREQNANNGQGSFSLGSINSSNTAKVKLPTLRSSLKEASIGNMVVDVLPSRKRGRPPRLKAI